MNKSRIAYEIKRVAHMLTAYKDGWGYAQQHQYLTNLGKDYTFTFRNKGMMELWDDELTGQMSDGAWENDSNSCWEFWASVKTQVGGKTSITPSQVPYGVRTGFAFSKLIEYVGDRMLDTIKKYEPEATENTLRAYLTEISEAMRKGEATPRGGTEALDKDMMRIKDIIKKYPNDLDKQLMAAARMAKSIMDIEKAVRRGKAADALGLPELAQSFYFRAKELMK